MWESQTEPGDGIKSPRLALFGTQTLFPVTEIQRWVWARYLKGSFLARFILISLTAIFVAIHSMMSFISLEYSVTRPFTIRWIVFSAFILGIIWLILITVLNVVAVAYETVPFTSTSFNDTTQLWYERFVPTFWLPSSRSCSGSVIPLNAGPHYHHFR